MIDPDRLRAWGNTFVLTVPLTADATLITLTAKRLRAANAGGGPGHIQGHRVVLLGMAYTYVAGAASVGFDLNAREYSYGTPSSPTGGIVRKIWEARSQAAGLVSLSVPDFYVPLTGPETSPSVFQGSPASPVTVDLAQPAQLELDVTGTAPTAGWLYLLGAFCDHNLPLVHDYQGSPFSVSA